MFSRSNKRLLKRHLHHYNEIRKDVDTIETTVHSVNTDMEGVINDMNNSTISLQTLETDIQTVATDVILLDDSLNTMTTKLTDIETKSQYQDLLPVSETERLYETNTNTLMYLNEDRTLGLRFKVNAFTDITLTKVMIPTRYIGNYTQTSRTIRLWDDNDTLLYTGSMTVMVSDGDNFALTINHTLLKDTFYKIGVDLLDAHPPEYGSDRFCEIAPVLNPSTSTYINSITNRYSTSGHGVLDPMVWYLNPRHILNLEFEKTEDTVRFTKPLNMNMNPIVNCNVIYDNVLSPNVPQTSYIARCFRTDDTTLKLGDLVEFGATLKVRKSVHNDMSRAVLGVFIGYNNNIDTCLVGMPTSVMRVHLEPNSSISIGDSITKSNLVDGCCVRGITNGVLGISMNNVVSAGQDVLIQCLLK